MSEFKMPFITRGMTPRQIITACDGFYESPKKGDKHVGPLVGYAGLDENKKQFVGFVYANFGKIEEWPDICREHVARPLLMEFVKRELGTTDSHLTYCGAPLGGLGLARDLAGLARTRCIYMEKLVAAVKTPTSKEVSDLVFGRHEPRAGEQVVIVEDVCNNFSTTGKMIDKHEERGANIVAITCFLNRSTRHGASFIYRNKQYPVISLWNEAMPEYRQTDPEAIPFIESGNVIFSPKAEWPRLQTAMLGSSEPGSLL